MITLTAPPYRAGVSQSDVSHAADSLLRAGERPTIDKVRAKIGRGSPNTINPMLDSWWKTLSARLDSGPAALHRLPETVIHIAEALWMQALEEGKRRAALEQRDSARLTELDKQRLEVRSHVLTLREGELDSRLRDRDRTIEELNLRLRELAGTLRKEQAARELLARRRLTTQPPTATRSVVERPKGTSVGRPRTTGGVRRAAPNNILARRKPKTKPVNAKRPASRKTKHTVRRAAPLRSSTKNKRRRRSTANRKKAKRG